MALQTAASHLGKRKRLESSVKPEGAVGARVTSTCGKESAESEDDVQDAFRRAFEKRFAPLDGDDAPRLREKPSDKKLKGPQPVAEDVEDLRSSDSDAELEDDFTGFDDASEEELDSDENSSISDASEGIEVVDATGTRKKAAAPEGFLPTGRSETRTFMSSKPPPSASTSKRVPRSSKPATEADDAAESAHQVNDLALQRLINESHLLSGPSSTANLSQQTSTAAATKSVRAKQLDMRVRALGGKGSTTAQAHMPLTHRRGIEAKKAEREGRRRKEAREAGIVLERPEARAAKKRERGKDRPVDAPAIGRFKGGTLSLSKRDLRGMASREARGGKKKGRR